jgi:endonuclease YncB( thermonuclease family)
MLSLGVLSALLLTQPAALDGDTVRAQTETFRLANIDAPEVGGRAQCLAERALGAKATVRARQLVASARRVEAMPTGRKDRYGRIIAHVTVDGRDLGETLISENLATPWRGRRTAWCE